MYVFNFISTYSNQIYYDEIVRLDSRIKHFIVNAIAKEFTETATTDIKSEIDNVRSALYGNS
jgi:hypothetical protein